MGIIKMTSAEIRKKYPLTPKRLKELKAVFARAAEINDPESPGFTDEELADAIRPGLMTVSELKKLSKTRPEYAPIIGLELKRRRGGRPKKEICKDVLMLRVDHFALAALRQSGRGWQTRVSDFISNGVKKGVLLKHV